MTDDSVIRNVHAVDVRTTLAELARAIDEARCIIVILPRGSASAEQVPPGPMDAWRDRNVGELELPVRAYNVLIRAGITTVGQLCRQTRRDLLRLAWSGRKTVEAIEEALAMHGLALRQE